MSTNLPTVSVIVPAKNAARTLPEALESIRAQTYSNIIQVIVAAADETTAESADDALVVMNKDGRTPVGLNLALEKATGSVVVRCDAHARLPDDYVERAIATMQQTGAVNVGGMQVPVGETAWERAIASAMSSPFGAGDAKYRIGGTEGPAETVYLGVFDRAKLVEAGGFDEAFSRNQDYELNHRLIGTGGVVWFDPSLRVEYAPRSTLRGLAMQYFQYGRAKRTFARKHAGSLRWRQLAPPVLVVVLAVSLIFSLVWPVLLAVPLVYLLGAVVVSLPSLRTAAALVTMHLAWGLGFLAGVRRGR